MRIRDWRFVDPPTVRALYDGECARWQRQLGWDTSEAWAEVESARSAGRLPGLVALDDRGGIRGWAYFLIEDRVAQVGSFVAEDRDTTRALIDSLLARTEGRADRITCFSFTEAPDFERLLTCRAFAVTRYHYLSRQCGGPQGLVGRGAEAWADDDGRAAAELLRAAYGPDGRYFAPHGLPEEWERYVRNLVEYPGCGRFDAASTRVQRDGDRLTGLVMMTTLGPGVSHVAQVAVHPDARGQGVAGRLLDEALALAHGRGRARATLLVEETAASARTLYTNRGFAPCATFMAARRDLG